MKLIKADNAPGFAKDMSNQAVLSTDLSALQSYKLKRQKTAEIDAALVDINTLKRDMVEIKILLSKILASKSGEQGNDG